MSTRTVYACDFCGEDKGNEVSSVPMGVRFYTATSTSESTSVFDMCAVCATELIAAMPTAKVETTKETIARVLATVVRR